MFPVVLKDDAFVEPENSIYYLVTKDGIFQVKKTRFWRSTVKVQGLSWLQGHREGLVLSLPKKIPWEIIAQAMGFFQLVWRKHRAEAIALLYFAPEEEQWRLEIPKQEVSHAGLTYEAGATEKGWILAGDIHSHASFGAFHSATDHKDEQFRDGFHITIGNVNSVPSLSCSIVSDGKRFQCDAEDVVEGYETPDIPQYWLRRVVKAKPPEEQTEPQNPSAAVRPHPYNAGFTETEWME